MNKHNKKLILADGSTYNGFGFGASGEVVSEAIIKTAISGYQNCITDTNLQNKIVLFTYPLIGNSGIKAEDYQVPKTLSGMIVKEVCTTPSHFQSEETLDTALQKTGIVGISGVDTRSISKKLRTLKNQKICIANIDADTEEILVKINA